MCDAACRASLYRLANGTILKSPDGSSGRGRGSTVHESRAVQIQQPVDEVFCFLRDFENDVRWRDELLTIRRLSGPPGAAHEIYEECVQWEGRTLRTTFEVVATEPDQAIEFCGTAEGVAASGKFTFSPTSKDKTQVTLSCELQTSGPLSVLEPFARALITRQVERDLRTLQTLLDRGIADATVANAVRANPPRPPRRLSPTVALSP